MCYAHDIRPVNRPVLVLTRFLRGDMSMQELNDIIIHAIDNIDEVTELFYQQKNNEALVKMEPIFVAISEISTQIVSLENDSSRILEILVQALNALEEKDYILLADILNYDMTEELKCIKDQL